MKVRELRGRASNSIAFRSRRLADSTRRKLLPAVFPPARGRRWLGPITEVHSEWAIIADPAADAAGSSPELIDLAITGVERARDVDLSDIAQRARRDRERTEINTWPGQHYRLLRALVDAWQARTVVEVGTYAGASALSMMTAASIETLTTFDLTPWSEFEFTLLERHDFDDRLVQEIGDLADFATFDQHADTLAGADVVFVDGPKDGSFEYQFIPRLLAQAPLRPRLIIIDDVRVMSMIDLWRQMPLAKLDLGSFGHWSGTGMVIQREAVEWPTRAGAN